MNNPVFRLVTNIYCISSLYRQNTSCFIMSALNDCFDTKTRLDNPFIISASGILVLRAWREGGVQAFPFSVAQGVRPAALHKFLKATPQIIQ